MEDALNKSITIKIAYDPVNEEWFVSESTVAGLKATEKDKNALVAALPQALFELTQIFVDDSALP